MKLRGARAALAAAVAIALVGASAFYAYAAMATEPEPALRTAVAKAATIQTGIPAEGRIEVETWDLAFASQGTVAKVHVKPGDKVTAGQVLAVLDGGKADAQVDQAQAVLAGAVAKLDGALAGPLDTDVAVKQASVDAAEASLAGAQKAYDLLVAESLLTTVSASELTGKEAAVTSARSALRIAAANLDAVRAGATPADIAAARAAVAQAEASGDVADIASGDLVIRSPVDGTVIEVNIKAGVAAPGGAPAITIADLDHLFLEASIDENDYAKAEVGLPVDVLVDALDGAALEGTVTALAPVGSADQNGIVTYALVASLDASGTRAAAGMTVRLEIITQRVTGALSIPNEAVRMENGKQVVSVVAKDGSIRTVGITVGMTDGAVVEIKSGLVAGDRVTLPGKER